MSSVPGGFRSATTDVLQDCVSRCGDPLGGVTEDGGLDLVQAGFVRVAFRLAFWELLHAPSFDAALSRRQPRRRRDTNGAIRARSWAHFGEDAIPKDWRAAVLEPRTRPEYHPRLLELVAR